MGTSNTIEQQKKLNNAFVEYIADQTKQLDKMTADAESEIGTRTEAYFKAGKWDDAAPLIRGRYEHLTTASEWSLDNVSKMIDALRNAMFGRSSTPNGSTVTKDPGVLANVAKMADMELLITTAAFNAIQGIMSTFTTGTDTSIQKDYATKELAPGMTLFLCVIENQYHRTDFLSDNSILQTAYVFDTRFSIKQAGDIANFDQVQSLIEQQHTAEDLITKFDKALNALDVTAANYDTLSTKYQASLAKLNAQVDTLKTQIDKLRSRQPA
jgi:hypothetical protein